MRAARDHSLDMKNKVWVCSWWVWSIVASLAGCEATHSLGSDCPDDVCPRALGRAEPACLIREARTLIRVESEEEPMGPVPEFFTYIVPSEPDEFGVRRYFWVLDRDFALADGTPLTECSDAPYLEDPEPESLQVTALQDFLGDEANPRPKVCALKRASFSSTDEVEVEGWYIDAENSLSGRRVVRFTDGVPNPPLHVTLSAMRSAAQIISRSGDLTETDANVCSLPEDSAQGENDVGRACTTSAVPDGGFDESEVVVETGSRECATGACLVYQLAGMPEASQEETTNRMYCSCRCDAPTGDPGELCACKSGYSCQPALLDAPPGIRGSYCMKNGTFNAN